MPHKYIKVKADNYSYDIMFHPEKMRVKRLLTGSAIVAIISNPTVFALHGQRFIDSYIIKREKAIVPIIIGDGERYKSQTTINKLYNQFLDIGLSRKDTIIAFGGGIVGDTAGFAAATFKRGVRLIQAPTSLLAMVDSSIGGKVGINHQMGKNLIGAFYQPQAIITDSSWLVTLGPREIAEGLAEIIKTGFLSDIRLAERAANVDIYNIEKELPVIFKLALQAMRFKARIVAQDTYDNGTRMILNFGHTFGHAIEKIEGYRRYRHGEAVLAGMVGALYLSRVAAKLSRQDMEAGLELVRHLIKRVKPLKMNARDYVKPMFVDKKNSNGSLVFVLLNKFGQATVKPINSERKVIDAISFMIDFVNS